VVGEDTPGGRRGGQEGAGESPAVWRSDLRFDLPGIGALAAKIYWSGGHIQVQVRAAHEPAAASLRAYGAQLATALDAAGLKLDSLQVQVDVPA